MRPLVLKEALRSRTAMVDIDHAPGKAVADHPPQVTRRVLVEHTDSQAGVATAEAIHDAGFAVATCPGPRVDDPCPVLRGQECSLAERADVIVSNLANHPEGKSIAACLRARLPRTPLLLNVEPGRAADAVHAALGL